jgi:ADP-ribosylglycohydrolase
MVGGGRPGRSAGEWTDDTAMALCLAESLVQSSGFDPTDQMRRFVRWMREGHLSATGRSGDAGRTTLAAISRFEKTGEIGAGLRDSRAAGNGSLMRLAPVPLFYATDPRAAMDRAAESSLTTHGAPAAVDACRYYAGLIVGALAGAAKDELLSRRYSPVPGYFEEHPLHSEVDEVACGSFHRREPPSIEGSGYVVRTLEAALWALGRSDDFAEGCLMAVNLGDDADTTAAVYGQLAGAHYGVHAIPGEWRMKLARRGTIEELADRLYQDGIARAVG